MEIEGGAMRRSKFRRGMINGGKYIRKPYYTSTRGVNKTIAKQVEQIRVKTNKLIKTTDAIEIKEFVCPTTTLNMNSTGAASIAGAQII